MVFVEKDSFRNLRRLPTDTFRSIPRLPRLPVAASDLVAWYPFRSGTGEDLTAGDSRFGDTTDYSAVVNGATFQASGGVTDIETGANSGAFDFDGTDESYLTQTINQPSNSYKMILDKDQRLKTLSLKVNMFTSRHGMASRMGQQQYSETDNLLTVLRWGKSQHHRINLGALARTTRQVVVIISLMGPWTEPESIPQPSQIVR